MVLSETFLEGEKRFPVLYQVCRVCRWAVSQAVPPVGSPNRRDQLPLGRRRLCGGPPRAVVLLFVCDPRLWKQSVMPLQLCLWRGLGVWEGHQNSGPESFLFSASTRPEWKVMLVMMRTKGISFFREAQFHSFKEQPISAVTGNHRSKAHGFHLDGMWNKI